VRSWKPDAILVALYLGAIVTANLVVAHYGQVALPFTAFLLIPFDLVTRDVLHERWQGPGLWARMLTLIASGSLLAAALNVDAARVALASFVAFGAANLTNALVFHALVGKTTRWRRMNTSNLLAAIVDSAVFPAIAFAVVDYRLSAAQAGSKFIGGIVFSSLFIYWSERCSR
jgi:hypothetical protein